MENNFPANGEPYNSGTPPKKPNTVVDSVIPAVKNLDPLVDRLEKRLDK